VKYLREESPFLTEKGDPLPVPSADGREIENISLSQILQSCMNQYQPDRGERVTTAEWKATNKIDAVFEAGTDDDGYYAIEDADFVIMKKMVLAMNPLLMRKHSPKVEASLDAVVDKKPVLETLEKAVPEG